MNRIATPRALLALFIAATMTGVVGKADPLHKHGHAGAWLHVDSGWIFPKNVGDFVRPSWPH